MRRKQQLEGHQPRALPTSNSRPHLAAACAPSSTSTRRPSAHRRRPRRPRAPHAARGRRATRRRSRHHPRALGGGAAGGNQAGHAGAPALKRCPDLVLLPPNPHLYARASRALHEVLRIYAPVIEPRGYGHAFLDLTGTGRLFGPAVDVAARVQREVRERLRLPVSVGIAANKLVSRPPRPWSSPSRCSRCREARRPASSRPIRSTCCPSSSPDAAAARRLSARAHRGGRRHHRERALRGLRRRGAHAPGAGARHRSASGAAARAAGRVPRRPRAGHRHQRPRRAAPAAPGARRAARPPAPPARARGAAAPGRAHLRRPHRRHPRRGAPRGGARRRAVGRARRAFTQANARRLAVRRVSLTLDRLEEAEGQLDLWGMVMAGGAETGTGNELPGAESGSGLGAGFPRAPAPAPCSRPSTASPPATARARSPARPCTRSPGDDHLAEGLVRLARPLASEIHDDGVRCEARHREKRSSRTMSCRCPWIQSFTAGGNHDTLDRRGHDAAGLRL